MGRQLPAKQAGGRRGRWGQHKVEIARVGIEAPDGGAEASRRVAATRTAARRAAELRFARQGHAVVSRDVASVGWCIWRRRKGARRGLGLDVRP
eukprot:scaffold4173_cov117-Isochrysis_galbana.AAC.9